MIRVICVILVLSRFDEFHGNDKEKCRWTVSFVASWYRAVLVIFLGNTAKKWDNVCYLSHLGTEPFLWDLWKISWEKWTIRVNCSIILLSCFVGSHGKYHETKMRLAGLAGLGILNPLLVPQKCAFSALGELFEKCCSFTTKYTLVVGSW